MANKPRKRKMVDISRPVPTRRQTKKTEPKIIEVEDEFKKLDREIEKFEKGEEKQFKKEEARKRKKRRLKIKKPKAATYIVIASLLLLAMIIYAAIEFLPRVEIKAVTKKTDWKYVDSVVAGKNIVQIDFEQKQIPAEAFSLTKNFTASFPATGKKMVEEKAGGTIIIYNAYSSEPQPLVANTRFLTPDGKIFRLVERITVPGAKIVEGKIVPSSLEAVVIANEPGPKYNIGPVSHFSIPGFQGSAKYQGFYAESKESMKGGFIGEAAFPTDEDIKIAKEKANEELKNHIESFLSLQIPPEFKIIEGSKQFSLLKQEINPKVDENNNFTVFSEGQLLTIAFRESDLKNLLEGIAQSSLEDNFKLKNYELEYGVARSDFKQGKISFAIDFQGSFEEPLDVEDIRQNAVNKKEQELKNLISSFPNIQKATISFWPFWVKRAPDDLDRIKVSVE
jgi:hypothetical protein